MHLPQAPLRRAGVCYGRTSCARRMGSSAGVSCERGNTTVFDMSLNITVGRQRCSPCWSVKSELLSATVAQEVEHVVRSSKAWGVSGSICPHDAVSLSKTLNLAWQLCCIQWVWRGELESLYTCVRSVSVNKVLYWSSAEKVIYYFMSFIFFLVLLLKMIRLLFLFLKEIGCWNGKLLLQFEK